MQLIEARLQQHGLLRLQVARAVGQAKRQAVPVPIGRRCVLASGAGPTGASRLRAGEDPATTSASTRGSPSHAA